MLFSAGKRIIVTGASAGIGFETARQLAADGAEIIMVCRSRERGESAMQRIRSELPDSNLALFVADMSSSGSIRNLVAQLERKYDHISILINNAGGLYYDRTNSEDGLEYTFALNHMGYFRLSTAVLPLMGDGGSAPARIISVSSEAHRTARLDFSDLQNDRSYKAFRVYSQSKLANILFTRELVKRTAGRNLEAVTLHPGFVNSNFGSLVDRRISTRVFKTLAGTFGVSPEKGAVTSVFLARAASVQNGAYYAGCKVRKPSAAALDDNAAHQLWDASEMLA